MEVRNHNNISFVKAVLDLSAEVHGKSVVVSIEIHGIEIAIEMIRKFFFSVVTVIVITIKTKRLRRKSEQKWRTLVQIEQNYIF